MAGSGSVMSSMVESLRKKGEGHRKIGPNTLDLMPDGSWELARYARTICVIDRNGNVRCFPDEDGSLSVSDVRNINYLTLAVLGRKHLRAGQGFEGDEDDGDGGDER